MTDNFQGLRELVRETHYHGAIAGLYEAFSDNEDEFLSKELLYLKRLARAPLEGRDILMLQPPSARSQLVNEHLDKYLPFIAEVLADAQADGRRTPTQILLECVPTMRELVDSRTTKYSHGLNLFDGGYHFEAYNVSEDDFTQKWDRCLSGRVFSRYPDPIAYCRALHWEQPSKYSGLWTTYSAEDIETNVYAKGLHVNWIDVYLHKAWRLGSPRRSPDFTTAASLAELTKHRMPTSVVTSNVPGTVTFTSRSHQLDAILFHEVDIHWVGDFQSAQVVGNPFLEAVEEVLREAENRLREALGLPRVGEGWVSETALFNLVAHGFPDAQHHASPHWLRPQHLDVFVPSIGLAIEYHGKQHFEPIEFFGGEKAFEDTARRDKRKEQLCRQNGISMVVWRYDEPVTSYRLRGKLADAGITSKPSE